MNNNELQHWGEKEDHKYVARIEINDPKQKYRYFYSNEAYQAYLNGLQKVAAQPPPKVPVNNVSSQNGFNKFISQVTKTAVDAKKAVDSKIEAVKSVMGEKVDNVNSFIFKGKETVFNTIDNPVSYPDVKKEVNLSNAKDPIAIAKSLVSNVIKGFTGEEMKPYDKIDSFEDLPEKKDDYTVEEDQAVINPDYNPEVYAYSNNCAYCTAAYELRQRGYDVEAAPVTPSTYNTKEEILSWYEGAEAKSFSTIGDLGNLMDISDEELDQKYYEACETKANTVKEELKQYGDGARGQFCLYWYGGGGHSMIWEVENNDVIVRDSQTNKIVDMAEYFTYATDGFYIRTDNLELSEDILKAVRYRY
jgi:hypothetical protein